MAAPNASKRSATGEVDYADLCGEVIRTLSQKYDDLVEGNELMSMVLQEPLSWDCAVLRKTIIQQGVELLSVFNSIEGTDLSAIPVESLVTYHLASKSLNEELTRLVFLKDRAVAEKELCHKKQDKLNKWERNLVKLVLSCEASNSQGDERDLDDELASLNSDLKSTQNALNLLFDEGFPEIKHDLKKILDVIYAEEDDTKYHKLPETIDMTAALLLLNAHIIAQHPGDPMLVKSIL